MLDASQMQLFTEKLIEEIKNFPLLYDRKYMRSRDGFGKEEAWITLTDRLPKDLNITVSETKKRWRTLKDCYCKYLRSGRTTCRFEARYRSWRWSKHMDFFKSHMPPGDYDDDENTSLNPPTNDFIRKRTDVVKKRLRNSDVSSKSEEHDNSTKDNEKCFSSSSKRIKGEMVEESLDLIDDESYKEMTNSVLNYADDQSVGWNETPEQPGGEQNISNFHAKSISSNENENFGDPLTGRKFDGLDLTFLGYASSIKKLSPRRQTLLKFSVAKLIMQEELAQQDEESRYFKHKTSRINTQNKRL